MNHPKPYAVKPGQESVWDYPRPAVAQTESARLRVVFGGRTLADTRRGVRTVETSHPPTYYFPPQDVDMAALVRVARTSFCEWKGRAAYYDVVVGTQRAAHAAWCYPQPTDGFALLKEHVAFYPALMDACFVNDEKVIAQPGQFYGGWITSRVVGPFKGAPGSDGW